MIHNVNPPTEDKLACGFCMFFNEQTDECRRRAPIAFYDGQGVFSVWPETAPESWCGEFSYDAKRETEADIWTHEKRQLLEKLSKKGETR